MSGAAAAAAGGPVKPAQASFKRWELTARAADGSTRKYAQIVPIVDDAQMQHAYDEAMQSNFLNTVRANKETAVSLVAYDM
jgi:hypothetical protein